LLQRLAADLPLRPAPGGEGTVQVMARVVGISDPPRRRRRPRSLRGRIVALAMVGALGTTGAVFAGGLPGAAQRVASTWFDRIGLTVPRPGDEAGPVQRGMTVSMNSSSRPLPSLGQPTVR
jgi:hypothetical protein